MKMFLILVAAIVVAVFVSLLLTKLAETKCASTCPNDPSAVVTRLEIGPLRYAECLCESVSTHAK